MRVSAIFLLAILSIDLPMVSLYFYKFTKVTCEISEQKTCSNKFCYLSTSEKSESLASFGCTLTRPITSLNVSQSAINLMKYYTLFNPSNSLHRNNFSKLEMSIVKF